MEQESIVVGCPECGRKNRVNRTRVGPEATEKPVCGQCGADLEGTVAIYTQTPGTNPVPGVDPVPGAVESSETSVPDAPDA